MSIELWLNDCEKMCNYLKNDKNLYSFFMNHDLNNKDIEFINNFNIIQNKSWPINDERYLCLCLKLTIQEIKRVTAHI